MLTPDLDLAREFVAANPPNGRLVSLNTTFPVSGNFLKVASMASAAPEDCGTLYPIRATRFLPSFCANQASA